MSTGLWIGMNVFITWFSIFTQGGTPIRPELSREAMGICSFTVLWLGSGVMLGVGNKPSELSPVPVSEGSCRSEIQKK